MTTSQPALALHHRPVRPPAWYGQAACAGAPTALWFPSAHGDVDRALAVCALCEVRGPCLEYALEHDEQHGIWGGVEESRRRTLLRTHRARSVPDRPRGVDLIHLSRSTSEGRDHFDERGADD